MEKIKKDLKKNNNHVITKTKTLSRVSEFAENIINTVREPMLVLDKELRVVKASRSFYEFFNVTPNRTIGKQIYVLGNQQWNIPKLRELLETVFLSKKTFDNFEVEQDFPKIGKRRLLLNARKIVRGADKEQIILLAIEDITQRKQVEEELITLETRYRRLFESAKDGIFILDAETGKIIDVNPFLIELLGYTKEKFLEKEIWEIGFFKDITANQEKFFELQSKEYVRYDNLPLETANGRRINVEFVSNVYLVNHRKVIQCNIRDITGRKEKEEGLEKTRKELAVIKISADEVSEFAENIINTVREPLLLLDKELRVVKASHSFYDFFKVSSEETIGTLIYDLGNNQWNIPKLRELLETILPEKTTFDNYEVEHDFSTIGKRIMLLNARKIQRGSGKEQIILLAIEDITQRKQVEEELITLETRYRRLFESAKDGIFILDAETGKIIDVNPFLIELLGYTKEKFLEKEIWEIGFFKDITANQEKFFELQSKEYVRYDNLPLETANGRRINVEFVSNVYLVNHRKVIQCNIRDITGRKEKEEGLEKTRKELVVIKKSADEVSEFAENIINTVREPLLLLDKELRVVKASRSFFDYFKVNSKETIGTLIYDLGNHQWDIPKLRELLETILPDKTTFDNYEVEHDFSTIGKRIMLLNARQIERANEKEKIILLAIEDITERKEIEDGLEKTRKELVVIKKSADEVSEFAENIINTVREPLLLLDKELRVVKASHSFYDYFKVNSKETIGTLIYDLGNRQWNIPKLRELLETILPEKTTFDNYEVEHDFSTIGKRIMLLNARKIRRGIGKEQIILLAIEDITKRKEIEAGLEKTRIELEVIKELADEVSEFTENIINTVREPLLVLDKELRVVKASRSFYDFFKVNSNETIGKLIYDLGNQQWNIPKLRELLETILPEKTTFDDYEVEHDFSTIGKRIMLLNARKIHRGTGKEQIILLAIEDITDRKKNENELSKAKTEAERANVAKSEFLSRMSHELRTPMNSILGFAQLMDMGELNPTHKKGVDQILKSGKHLLNLINEVLDVAKIEAGRLTISPEPVEILGIIMEAIDIVSHLAEENKVKLELDIPTAKGLFVKADHQRLKQVLLNLLTNAVKYNKVNGSVKVVCEIKKMEDGEGRIENKETRKVDAVRINVVDTGKGIAQEYIVKLFNPFERIGAERTETEGTGLGLAISKKLIGVMGGKIGVQSEVGIGSTFWIELPQIESQMTHYGRINELAKPESGVTQNSGTILYIEDNLSNIQLVEQILEAHRPTIRLITNIYGKKTVQFAIDYTPDLILLDLDLPDIHGSEVLKLLHAEPKTSEIPVVILSADAMTKQIERLMEAGAEDYLIKPIDVGQFLKVVDDWMKKGSKKKIKKE